MGYRYDFFVAPLRCPRCGTTWPADAPTCIQTAARRDPQLTDIAVGDEIDVPVEDMVERNYVALRHGEPGPIVLLETWDCPNCGLQWARIEIEGGIVTSITSVELDREIIAGATYASPDIVDYLKEVTGMSYDELMDADFAALLRRG